MMGNWGAKTIWSSFLSDIRTSGHHAVMPWKVTFNLKSTTFNSKKNSSKSRVYTIAETMNTQQAFNKTSWNHTGNTPWGRKWQRTKEDSDIVYILGNQGDAKHQGTQLNGIRLTGWEVGSKTEWKTLLIRGLSKLIMRQQTLRTGLRCEP